MMSLKKDVDRYLYELARNLLAFKSCSDWVAESRGLYDCQEIVRHECLSEIVGGTIQDIFEELKDYVEIGSGVVSICHDSEKLNCVPSFYVCLCRILVPISIKGHALEWEVHQDLVSNCGSIVDGVRVGIAFSGGHYVAISDDLVAALLASVLGGDSSIALLVNESDPVRSLRNMFLGLPGQVDWFKEGAKDLALEEWYVAASSGAPLSHNNRGQCFTGANWFSGPVEIRVYMAEEGLMIVNIARKWLYVELDDESSVQSVDDEEELFAQYEWECLQNENIERMLRVYVNSGGSIESLCGDFVESESLPGIFD